MRSPDFEEPTIGGDKIYRLPKRLSKKRRRGKRCQGEERGGRGRLAARCKGKAGNQERGEGSK